MADGMVTPDVPTFADVEMAAARLRGVAHRTPVLTSRTLDSQVGGQVFFKCENLQRSGSFKFRGAMNAIRSLTPAERKAGVVAFSSGNHAQGIAMAGQLEGVPTVIVMPTDAPAAKVAATKGYGGEVVLYDRYKEDRNEIGRRLASERGLTLIPPFDHPAVIAGQGTAARELFEDVGPLDTLVVCMGGGGLLSGSALSAAALSPTCKVYGVEPEAGNDGQRSFRSGQIVEIAVPVSIADGALTTRLADRTFAIIREKVTDILTASDAELVGAMRFFAERMKLVVEPTGCLAASVVLGRKIPTEGRRIGVILSGGNVDIARFAEFLARGPEAA